MPTRVLNRGQINLCRRIPSNPGGMCKLLGDRAVLDGIEFGNIIIYFWIVAFEYSFSMLMSKMRNTIEEK